MSRTSPNFDGRRIEALHLLRCSCGRFVSTARSHGWYRFGEHGTEEGYVCSACLPDWAPADGRGRGPEAGYCGIFAPTKAASPTPLRPAAAA
jgi:hypothetical protein